MQLSSRHRQNPTTSAWPLLLPVLISLKLLAHIQAFHFLQHSRLVLCGNCPWNSFPRWLHQEWGCLSKLTFPRSLIFTFTVSELWINLSHSHLSKNVSAQKIQLVSLETSFLLSVTFFLLQDLRLQRFPAGKKPHNWCRPPASQKKDCKRATSE